MEMTKKERLLAAARGLTVDRPPCICPGGMMNMIFEDAMEACGAFWPEAHTDAEKMASLAMALRERQGFENFGVPFCMTVEAEAFGAEVNMGDKLTEPHVIDSMLASAADHVTMQEPDFESGRVKTVIDAVRIMSEAGTDYPVIGNLTGPFSVAGTLVDMTILLKEFRRKPAEVHALMAKIADFLAEFARRMVAAGADVICLSEPSGTGEILGPRWFKEFSVQYINRVMDGIDGAAKIVHICGDLSPVYEDLKDLHCDAFSCDSIVSLRSIRPHLPGKAVMGNVNTHALGTAPAERISRLAAKAIEQGADILAPACGLPSTTPIANVNAMVQAAMDAKRA